MTAATPMARAIPGIPTALHRGESELPFVDMGDLQLQLLQVDVEAGLWVVRTRMQPGVAIQRHEHTGEVFAVAFRGANLDLDEQGIVQSVVDASSVLAGYLGLCRAAGLPAPNGIGA